MMRKKERRRAHHLSQREEALGPEKRNENRADVCVFLFMLSRLELLVIGTKTFNDHCITMCYYYLSVDIRLIHPPHSLVMYR